MSIDTFGETLFNFKNIPSFDKSPQANNGGSGGQGGCGGGCIHPTSKRISSPHEKQ
ncbi:hypothetical protein ACL9RJ_17460 [Pseudomonas sp. Mn2068]|uniref:hypothetical protein n=1 Tax=Pseudomonas sp. Mn2068 TaxID=3395265 RepID=UPI003BD97773